MGPNLPLILAPPYKINCFLLCFNFSCPVIILNNCDVKFIYQMLIEWISLCFKLINLQHGHAYPMRNLSSIYLCTIDWLMTSAGIVVPQRLTLQLTFIFHTFAKVNLDRLMSYDIQAFPSWTCFSFRQLFNFDPKILHYCSLFLYYMSDCF